MLRPEVKLNELPEFPLEALPPHGVAVKAFKNAPRSLREVFASARARGDATFLVYEDERWSFAEVMAHVDALAALLVDRYGVAPGDRVGSVSAPGAYATHRIVPAALQRRRQRR